VTLRTIVVPEGPESRISYETTEYLSGNVTVTEHPDNWRTKLFTLIGEDIPHYHKRKRSGELLPHTSYEVTDFLTEKQGGLFEFSNPAGTVAGVVHYDASYPWPAGSASVWSVSESEVDSAIPADINDLLQVAAARIYSKGHDIATTIAELHETRTMFKDIVRRWTSKADDITTRKTALVKKDGTLSAAGKAYNKRVRGKRAKSAADLLLEARYGWRPLFSEIQSLDQAIREFDRKRQRYSENVRRLVSKDTSESTLDLSNVYCDYGQKTVKTVEVSIGASVSADIRPPQFAFNPLVTGWEVVPLSFVVDWFIGVGTYLESLSFLTIVDQYYASSGYLVKISKDTEYFYKTPRNGYSGNVVGTTKSYGFKKVRVPSVLPSVPQFRLNLDAWKVMDLVALGIQRYTGVKATWLR